MESSFMVKRKQEDICGRGQPLLKRVGVAWVKSFWDIMWYVWIAASTSCLWMPTLTRMSMCCGRSAICPSHLSR